MRQERSRKIFEEAQSLFVGGVNSPVRAFGSVGGTPIVPRHGKGAWIEDVDGNRYADYLLSWGPLIHGHAPDDVVEAVREAVARGTSFGMPTEAENRLGRVLKRFFPELERLRMVNSGTEATMSCIRLARGATGRSKVVKFSGCYHGHVDALLVEAGSGMATFGVPASPGIAAGLARDTLSLPFNDSEALRLAFSRYGEEIAAVILETVPANMGLVFPDPEFLETLQDLCESYQSVLVADEVLTGLRAARGGAYHRFGINPDLVAVGKVIGGGFPVGAYGGRRDLMAQLSPEGPVYQAGTLSGNPIAATAGAVSLERLEADDPFRDLEALGASIAEELRTIAKEAGIPVSIGHVGSILGLFFREGQARDFEDVQASDTERYRRFFWGMLRRGVHLAPSAFEVAFLSTAHDEEVVDHTLSAARDLFQNGIDTEDAPSVGK